MKEAPKLGLGPKFMRGDIVVSDGAQLRAEHPKVLVSSAGVFGLRWPPFSPAKHFGKSLHVAVELKLSENKPLRFETPASVIREITMRSERMGLKFLFKDAAARERAARIIETHGHLPTEYVRKYPRIPAQQFIDQFQLRATGLSQSTGLNHDPKQIVYRIGNLSPDGFMLIADSILARFMRPGDLIDVVLGSDDERFSIPEIRAKGKIFRCVQEVVRNSGAESWQLGIRIHKMDDRHRQSYFALLQGILKHIQGRASGI